MKKNSGKVLIVGVGGLGAECLYMLAQSGVKKIGIIDKDILDISNLHRQIIYKTKDEKKSKVFLAKEYINERFPEAEIETYFSELNNSNIALLKDYDVVVDATDNFEAKFLLNDASYFYKKYFITSGVIQFHGQILSINPGKSTCLRCIFFNPPSRDLIPTCRQAGVFGPLPGMFGMLESMEVIRCLQQKKMLYINNLFTYNALALIGRKIKVTRNIQCPLCGNSPEIRTLEDSFLNIFGYNQKISQFRSVKCNKKND